MNKGFFLLMSVAFLASCGGTKGKLTDYDNQEGVFEWQFPNKDNEKAWHHYSYSVERWWGISRKIFKYLLICIRRTLG